MSNKLKKEVAKFVVKKEFDDLLVLYNAQGVYIKTIEELLLATNTIKENEIEILWKDALNMIRAKAKEIEKSKKD